MTSNLLGALLQIATAAPAANPPEMIGPPECRHLVIHVVDGATKESIKGARVMELSLDPPDRALSAFLAKRAGLAGENGFLDLGFIPAAAPSQLRISAPGFRTVTLKLGARFEEGKRDVVLVPNQDVEVRVTGLQVRRSEARPEVSLARCRYQGQNGGCGPTSPTSKTLDENGLARFPGLEGGLYEVEVRPPGLGKTHQHVEVASDGDVATLVVEIPLTLWTFHGTTRLHSGTLVSAQIRAVEWVDSRGGGVAAETTSSTDGTFELRVVSQASHKMGLSAKSEDPRAETNGMELIRLSEDSLTVDGVDLQLETTGLEVAIRDARTNQPVPGCEVGVTLLDSSRGNFGGLESDADGFVRAYGLSEGKVRATVQCEKYYAKELGVLDIVRDEVRHVDAFMEAAQDLVLAAVGEDGGPIVGASVSVAGPLMSGVNFPGTRVSNAGITDAQGEILLQGDRYGGQTAYLIAPGRAVGIQILPTLSSCDKPEDCRVPVLLRNPSSFAGLAIRTESGKPLSLYEVGLSAGGISIPSSILRTLLSVNGLPADAPSTPLEVNVASFFPPGSYVVVVDQQRPDPKTKKLVWTELTLGAFNVPSLEKIELLDPDGPPPPKAQVTAVAAR
jgi:hypothetical protein